MSRGKARETRATRADAVRNRDKVLAAAHRVFTTRGAEVSMRDVASEAGVGLGTIYRHFPDKESLLAGLVESRFRGLAAETRAAMDSLPPWEAFARIMRRMAVMMTEDRAFAGSIAAARHPAQRDGREERDEALARRDEARGELDVVLGQLADAAKEAGDLRDDVGPMELGMLLAGAAVLGPGGESSPVRDRYLTVVLDGLRSTSRGASEA